MESFETKKALLEYLGKNPDDRKLVDRLIAKGSVRMEEGMYCTNLGPVAVWNVEVNNELEDLCSKLRKRNEELEKRCKELMASQWEDLYYHLKFFYEKFMDWKKFVDGKAFGQAQYNNQQWVQDTTEMVKPEVYARYNFSYWDVEKSECEFVEALINERIDNWLELPF